MRISVIGGGDESGGDESLAEAVGQAIGSRGHTLVCGGLGGAMEAACRGAKAENGSTIGILPGIDRQVANRWVDIAIGTGIGHARNAFVVANGDGVIALAGGSGTLTEIGYAMIYERPIAGIETHELDGIERFERPDHAVEYIEDVVEETVNP